MKNEEIWKQKLLQNRKYLSRKGQGSHEAFGNSRRSSGNQCMDCSQQGLCLISPVEEPLIDKAKGTCQIMLTSSCKAIMQ